MKNSYPQIPFEKKSENKDDKTRLLFRERDNYMFGGVLGGLGRYWNIDPSVLRLIFLILVPLSGCLIIIIYLILMKSIPLEPE